MVLPRAGEGGRAGEAVSGEGTSSSSSTTGDAGLAAASTEPRRFGLDMEERPLAADLIELASARSFGAPSSADKLEPDTRGLTASLASLPDLIFLRTEDRIDLLLLSWVSLFEMEGYCLRPSGTRLLVEPFLEGVRMPSLDLD